MSVLVGQEAPDFTTAAVMANGDINYEFNLSAAIRNKYALIFFYPLDFTFVCPSELIALHNRIPVFKKKGVEVIAVSIDSQFTHNAYRQTPIAKGGIGEVDYTMAADINHQICRAYGVEHPVKGVAFRAAFVIDNKGMIRAQVVNDLAIGRDIDELLRLVDAVQHSDEHGEVCPAGWKKGDVAMDASLEGVAKYLAQHAENL